MTEEKNNIRFAHATMITLKMFRWQSSLTVIDGKNL